MERTLIKVIVACPYCKHVHKIQTVDFIKDKWDCTDCLECKKWFTFDMMKYKEQIIVYNVTQGFTG